MITVMLVRANAPNPERRRPARALARLGAAVVLALAVTLAALARPAAAEGLSLIRDAEIENTLEGWAAPLLRAAGISPESVTIRMVRDDSLNAFVTVGNRLFLHTGLLMRSENAGQVLGVLAHEIGHIAGGHAVRFKDEIDKARTLSMIAGALGMAAAVGSGRGDVGTAVILGGSQAAMRGLFSYSRTQESAADQAALKYLEATGQSAEGLVEFFEILGGQESLQTAQQDPYVRTHPLTRERITSLAAQVAESALPPAGATAADQIAHARMVAKLRAFLEPPATTFARWPETDTSLTARYAHAVAYYREGRLDRALPVIDGLIADYPRDPYFHELRGQMLLESGRVVDSLESYRQAVALAPEEPLIRISLAHALIEARDDALLAEAEEHLNRALRVEKANGFAWRLLATVYGRRDDMTMASYAMAESALLQGDPEQARFHAGRAEQGLKVGEPTWLKVQDVQERARAMIAERKREG